jgi:hypothetical protein
MRIASDEHEQKCLDDIKGRGVHIVHVYEDEENPRFSYTVGLYHSYLHPEVIIIGLKFKLAHILLNNIAEDVKIGKNFTSGKFHEGVLDNFLCYFGSVPKMHYKEYVGWAIWFYEGNEFPLVQCVYPTISGKFVWEKDFPEDARFFCRLLTGEPKEH